MKRTLWAAVAVALVLSVGLQPAEAQGLAIHQNHTVTLNEPVRLVSGVTLPAGTYLFTFFSPSHANVTTIRSVDWKTVYATLTTVPRQRQQRAGFAVVLAAAPRGNGPRLLKAWFCDGTNTGHEFIPLTRKL